MLSLKKKKNPKKLIEDGTNIIEIDTYQYTHTTWTEGNDCNNGYTLEQYEMRSWQVVSRVSKAVARSTENEENDSR